MDDHNDLYALLAAKCDSYYRLGQKIGSKDMKYIKTCSEETYLKAAA
jgi:hypothetical protein